mmetsp:Transcript_5679/g.11474  ORF Transcript_5679/g.11474 Transcript_5679/m.11474 type:complete len:122 (+) Transcript_5679:341-706(+)
MRPRERGCERGYSRSDSQTRITPEATSGPFPLENTVSALSPAELEDLHLQDCTTSSATPPAFPLLNVDQSPLASHGSPHVTGSAVPPLSAVDANGSAPGLSASLVHAANFGAGVSLAPRRC